MSEQNPGQPWVPPPPPQSGNSMYSAETLAARATEIGREARNALIMSIIGLICFGFILGFLAFRKANQALDDIRIYDVAHDKKGIAMAAKILAIIDIIGWIAGLVLRFTLLSR